MISGMKLTVDVPMVGVGIRMTAEFRDVPDALRFGRELLRTHANSLGMRIAQCEHTPMTDRQDICSQCGYAI